MTCMFLEEDGKPMCRGRQPGWRLENEYLNGRRRYTREVWARVDNWVTYQNGFGATFQKREGTVNRVVGMEYAWNDWSRVDCPQCHAWRKDPQGMRRREQAAAADQARDRRRWEKVTIFLVIVSAIGLAIGLFLTRANGMSGGAAVTLSLLIGTIPGVLLLIPILLLSLMMPGGGSSYPKIARAIVLAIALAAIAIFLAGIIFYG